MSDTTYAYVLVRTDIPLADQMVQVGHATLEAGGKFTYPPHTHMVLLQVPCQKTLLKHVERLERHGIASCVYWEPDDDMHHTAACFQPIAGDQRKLFAALNLWGNPE